MDGASASFQDTVQTDFMRNGHIVSDADRRRSGIVWIGNCTGTVFRTSAFRRETWVITAAHCFYSDSGDTAVLWDRPEGTLLGENGVWTRHPDYQSNPYRHDIAIVKYPFGVTIENADSPPIHEYYRPMCFIDLSKAVAIFGMGVQEDVGFCAGTELEWDFSLRYTVEDEYESQGYGMIETESFDAPAAIRPGDSGGPWISTVYGSTSLGDVLEDGIIVAVTSNVECGDDVVEGSTTFAGLNEGFIIGSAGNAAVFNSYWTRPTCWTDWCNYSTIERVSLTMAALSVI
jgi:hypothetical protein